MITLLNTAILTTYGKFDYQPITLEQAKAMLSSEPYQSAVGHKATAQVLSDLLGVPIAENRIEYKQDDGETALVFKLRSRLPEGKILSQAEIEEIGYDFGLLSKES